MSGDTLITSANGDAANIVNHKGLTYREAQPGWGHFFAYKFEFQHPYEFYLVEVDIPDDKDRVSDFAVTSHSGYAPSSTQTGPGFRTGVQYPLSGTMKTVSWIHWADPGPQTFEATSYYRHLPGAAAARVRFFHIGKTLPEIAVNDRGARFLGLHTERARTLHRPYGPPDPGSYQHMFLDKLKLDIVQGYLQRLYWYYAGTESYAQYCRFTGQNLHVFGSFQYSENNNSIYPPRLPGETRLLLDNRDTLARVLDANGISTIALIEFSYYDLLKDKYSANNTEIARGADTVYPVSRKGSSAGGEANISMMNIHHPVVQEHYYGLIGQLRDKFQSIPFWKGVYIMVYPGFSGPLTYTTTRAPLDYDYSDVTMAAFERDTGIHIPVDKTDPSRFEKRHLFLTSDAMCDTWIRWRCESIVPMLRKTRDLLQVQRKDLQVLYGYYYALPQLLNWLQDGHMSYLDGMRLYGMDPTTLAGEKDVWTGRYLYPSERSFINKYGYAATWEQHTNPEAIQPYTQSERRLAVLNTCWHEIHHPWPRSKNELMPEGFPLRMHAARYVEQPHLDYAREHYSNALLGTDPRMVFYGFTDVTFPSGNEQQLREFAQVLRSLPAGNFEVYGDTLDFQHNFMIRHLAAPDAYWFYVANPGYWPATGTVELSMVTEVQEPATGRSVNTRQQHGHTEVLLDLKPYEVQAFKTAPQARIVAWDHDPLPDRHTAHMRNILDTVAGHLSDPNIRVSVTDDERAYLAGQVREGRSALESGHYAQAWAAATHWKLWTLLHDHMAKEAEMAARIPGYKPRPREQTVLPTLEIVRTKEPPAIDGKLRDAAWKKAPFTDSFVALSARGDYRGTPVIDTAAKALYDDTSLYLSFTMADPDITALKTEAVKPIDGINKWDDAMVFHLNPADNRIYQFGVNAAGLQSVTDATGQTGMFRVHDPDFGAWEAATATAGNLWTLEVAIPFSSLQVEPPAEGDTWKANFLRRFRQHAVPEMYWSMIETTWYDLHRYGTLEFK